MRIAYLDCFAGIAGDMFLGALLDAGVPAAALDESVAALNLGASLRVSKVDRSGIQSTKVDVLEGGRLAEAPGDSAHSDKDAQEPTGHRHDPEHAHRHRHSGEHEHSVQQTHGDHAPQPHAHGRSLSSIRRLVEAASLHRDVKEFALRTFELLGQSEAKIHNVPVEKIHFHEVGAVDAIVDIVAAAAGIAYLQQAGPITWFCSPVNVGGGTVECAHGTFPVPAPATADLLREAPTYSAHVLKELVTPTGAALLRALGLAYGAQPAMRVEQIGYGAGSRNPHRFPNVLRLSLGQAEEGLQSASSPDPELIAHANTADVVVLETAIDDATAQVMADVAERALAHGALDVMLTPVIMKKGRAGTLLTVLADPGQSGALERLLLRETTTLGIRKRIESRICLDRRHQTVETEYGAIRIKIGSRGDEEWNAAPEFEDCRAASVKYQVPVKLVLQAAFAAYLASKTTAAQA